MRGDLATYECQGVLTKFLNESTPPRMNRGTSVCGVIRYAFTDKLVY